MVGRFVFVIFFWTFYNLLDHGATSIPVFHNLKNSRSKNQGLYNHKTIKIISFSRWEVRKQNSQIPKSSLFSIPWTKQRDFSDLLDEKLKHNIRVHSFISLNLIHTQTHIILSPAMKTNQFLVAMPNSVIEPSEREECGYFRVHHHHH